MLEHERRHEAPPDEQKQEDHKAPVHHFQKQQRNTLLTLSQDRNH